MRGYLLLGLASEMPKYSARRLGITLARLALHTVLRTMYQRRQLFLQVTCLTVLLLANNNGVAVSSRSCRRFQSNKCWLVYQCMVHLQRCQQWLSIARHSPSRNCLCTAHARQGGIAFGRWGSMYFCDVCPVHHIRINYFVICMIY